MEQKINEKLEIKDMIYTIRGQQVMLDFDLARVFGYEVKNLNRQVKRHSDEFTENETFQLSKEELEDLRCQFGTANINSNSKSRTLPNAFTLQGIEILGTVLRAENIQQIMSMVRDAFANELPDSMLVIPENTDDINNLIYFIRGTYVMLDTDLAKFYGYEVKRLNEQVKNNIERFPSDFMFQLSLEEIPSRSKFSTLKGQGNNIKYAPYAFTEEGVYMLSSVLKGKMAVAQSICIMRAFKQMRHYHVENRQLVDINLISNLSLEVGELNARSKEQQEVLNKLDRKVESLDVNFNKHEDRLNKVDSNLMEMTEKIEEVLNTFTSSTKSKEFAFLDGDLFEASVVFNRIYSQAKTSIIVIDDYIGIETLNKLNHVDSSVAITIISDNKARNGKLTKTVFEQFTLKHPHTKIKSSGGKIHDRFIVIDCGTEEESIYLSGTSSKDAGTKMCMIISLKETTSADLHIQEKLINPELVLS